MCRTITALLSRQCSAWKLWHGRIIPGERWLREDVVEQGSELIKCHPTKGSAKGNLTSGTKEVTQPVK